MSVYRVTGRRGYRGHQPGTFFEAQLNAEAERRALARGDITLVHAGTPALVEGTYRLPAGTAQHHLSEGAKP